MLRFHPVLLLALLASGPAGPQATVDVGRFDAPGPQLPAPWRLIRFDTRVPATVYKVIEWDGVPAVEARANASMALMARPLQIDLRKTPVLCWRWRIDAPLLKADMTKKAGDDFAARLYVTFKLPAAKMDLARRTRRAIARQLYGPDVPDAALNYVWDNRQPVGTRLPSLYTSQSEMIVLRSGGHDAGHWVQERRDILADAVTIFGTEAFEPNLLAIGSDTDNTGEKVRAGFAELRFVARGASCG